MHAAGDALSGTPHGAYEGPGGGHYDNMTTTSRTKVGCGFYQTTNGAWWIVEDFR